MKVKIQSIQAQGVYEAENPKQVKLLLEGGSDFQSQADGFRPTEALLAAAGGCAILDVGSILTKQKQTIAGLGVEVSGERAMDQIPRVFTSLHLQFSIHKSVESKKAERAVELSVFKYCTVISSLDPKIKVTTSIDYHE